VPAAAAQQPTRRATATTGESRPDNNSHNKTAPKQRAPAQTTAAPSPPPVVVSLSGITFTRGRGRGRGVSAAAAAAALSPPGAGSPSTASRQPPLNDTMNSSCPMESGSSISVVSVPAAIGRRSLKPPPHGMDHRSGGGVPFPPLAVALSPGDVLVTAGVFRLGSTR
jgi:hypothetical protein